MTPLRILYIKTLTYIFSHTISGNIKIYSISKMVRVSEKCSSTTFLQVDICHWRKCCECCTMWPWPSFSRSNIFLLCICYKKLHRQRISPADLLRLARPSRAVALVQIHYMLVLFELETVIVSIYYAHSDWFKHTVQNGSKGIFSQFYRLIKHWFGSMTDRLSLSQIDIHMI